MDKGGLVVYLKNIGRELAGLNEGSPEVALRYAKEKLEEALERIEERKPVAPHQNITDEMWASACRDETDAEYG